MTVIRKKRVSQDDFINGYVKGCKADLTSPEIAEILKMAEASMIARASSYRRQAAEIGKLFPTPKGSTAIVNSKKERIDLLTNLLGDLEADTDDTDSDESVE